MKAGKQAKSSGICGLSEPCGNRRTGNCYRRSFPVGVLDKKGYFSSRTMAIAFFGHSFAQIPQPLQYPRSTVRSLLMMASGQ
jgi:hypothetical protein